VGDERGQPETGIWTRAADPHPVRPGEYRPRRAKPEPPDPYLPRSEHPLRSGPYLREGAGSDSELFSPARPDPLRDPFQPPAPLRDPFEPPDPAPARGPAGPPVPGGAFGWWNTNGNFASDREQAPGEQAPREQAPRDQAPREQAARWHTGKRDAQDEPVPAQPGDAPAGGPRPDADRYPADYPTQVFMSSALAAWQQPAPPAPSGNWPRQPAPDPFPGADLAREPSARAGRPGPPVPPPADASRPPMPAPPSGPRRAPEQPRPAGLSHPRDLGPAPGGFPSAERNQPGGAHRAVTQHQEAPFPPAPDPADLYPRPPGVARPGANPPHRSRADQDHRPRHGLLIGLTVLAVLFVIAVLIAVA
jgi:hypothetical protein